MNIIRDISKGSSTVDLLYARTHYQHHFAPIRHFNRYINLFNPPPTFN
ncbi:hypothetical protein Q4493_03570 [Colwellia sp. 1_MG-2023]|nr:hypothetical protein [Colwellia sp. 1_MG-2023]MDO6444850.1 hypothetical protein [Colwellia sp. 1_MG-2023]